MQNVTSEIGSSSSTALANCLSLIKLYTVLVYCPSCMVSTATALYSCVLAAVLLLFQASRPNLVHEHDGETSRLHESAFESGVCYGTRRADSDSLEACPTRLDQ